MMSTVCHRFVQNAWKKERCSNCFKSREEHITVKRETPVSRRPVSGTKSRGILKAAPGPGRRKRAVSFKPELAEVIGFGGEEWEDASEFELSEESSAETSEDDSAASGDEDKALEKLTKSNTELNANIAPATTTDRRRTFTQLMLGQPQKDAEGKKQTLLVSVTPFGQDDGGGGDRTATRRGAKSTVSHIPIAKNTKDLLLVESRSKVVLTGYTKNRESPELLTKPGVEKKQQPQQPQQTSVAEESKRETVSNNKDSGVRRAVTAAKCDDVTTVHQTSEQHSLTIREQSTTQTVETSTGLKTTEQLTQQINEIRQNTLDLLQRSTTTTATANDVKQKTTEASGATLVSTNESRQITLTSASKQLNVVGQETSDGATDVLINGNSLREECVVGDELKFDEVDEKVCAVVVETRNNEFSVSSTIAAALDRNANITTTNNGSVAGETVQCDDEPIVKSELSVQLRAPPVKRDAQVSVSGQLVENNISSSEESADSLGPAQSREQAGEPDGRADPDVLCEPPALPRSPPPLLAAPPRPSFLHGTSPRLTPAATSAAVAEKPKVPCKPDKVAQMLRKPQLDLSPLPVQPLTPTLDPSKLPFKRRAPNPPPTPTLEDITGLPSEIFPPDSCDTVVIRSISMQEPDVISSTHSHEAILAPCPEPAPRKIELPVEKVDEKRKDKTRTRFSLKKFLRVGSKSAEKLKLEEIKEKNTAAPKVRLVIVHPLELNGSGVEVMAPPAGEDVQPAREVAPPPAPPPRNIPEKRVDDPKPPPKSEETIRRQRQLSTASATAKASATNNNNVYANLGECRSGLAPSKPQRTASMREREALLEQQSRRLQLQKPPEHVYERIAPRRHSDEANSGHKEQRSFNCTPAGLNFYSGSEPDLELYAPCGSYYGS